MTTLLEPWWNGQKRYTGLSTDERPTDARNGDMIIEIDTRKIFLYSEEDDTWYEQPTGSGDGGSDSEDKWTTADVAISNTDASGEMGFCVPALADEPLLWSMDAVWVTAGETMHVTIPLYKGQINLSKAYFMIPSRWEYDLALVLEVTGSVQETPGSLIITGDCAIAASSGYIKEA